MTGLLQQLADFGQRVGGADGPLHGLEHVDPLLGLYQGQQVQTRGAELEFQRDFNALLQATKFALLPALLAAYFERGYTNSVAGLSSAGEYRYDKYHLVPFGEFIPSGFRWFTAMMNIPLGDFARGVVDPPSFAVGAQRVAPNICYEDLFGEELARRFADPATAPTVLVNLSNIGWFGDTIATVQHLNISRMRALEFQRPMIRATNTGATAIVDHRGVVQAMLPPHTRGVLTGSVQGRDGITPFAWWAARAGLWPLALGALLVVLAAAWRKRPTRRSLQLQRP